MRRNSFATKTYVIETSIYCIEKRAFKMEKELIKSESLHLPGYYESFKKSTDVLVPIFEAISNAWESFPENQEERNIGLRIHYENLLDIGIKNVDKIEVIDNGIGFNEENYERFIRFNDNRKSSKNKGTGRVQYLKFFQSYKLVSTFEEKGAKFARTLISSQDLINKNILLESYTPSSCNNNIGTIITFNEFINKKDEEKFTNYSIEDIKNRILQHFLLKGATSQNPPIIAITTNEGNRCIIDKNEYIKPIKAVFSVAIYDENAQQTGITQLNLDIFKFPKEVCKNNQLFVSSKGEYVKELNMSCMKDKAASFDGLFYVVAVNGDFLDKFVNNQRSDLSLPAKNNPYFPTLGEVPFMYYEDLEEQANKAILNYCPEIKTISEEHKKQVAEIAKEFGIRPEILAKADIKTSDSTERIIKKCYKVEADESAKKDTKVFILKKEIKELNPNTEEYEKSLTALADKLNETVSLQNKEHLSRYISRRKIVLDLLESILNHSLEIQNKSKKNENEALLHNTLFKKKSNNPLLSDLWVLDETAIYYDGVSDSELKNIEYNGKLLFSSGMLDDDVYCEANKRRRPDILLFPREGKCIIIELKSPDISIKEFLGQASEYASLINTYCREDISFEQFYIYLIGENYSYKDIVSADSTYRISSSSNNILFKNAPVAHLNNPTKPAFGYYEVLSYSSIIERAKTRNKIFIDKLFSDDNKT